ncbi:hypothetical protein [Cronobacter sakazakii]|uniref:hypothetical protein n=1 Tax=Cronobacter sakazakii TaxID=28141 RepID=UPI001575DF7F|nr:hypothetical protein [Cronobacter sakazakii]
MNTSRYALSRSERGWLAYSFAFVLSAVFYGFLIGRISRAFQPAEVASGLLDLPALLLISLSIGFLMTATGHYAIRQSFVRNSEEDS